MVHLKIINNKFKFNFFWIFFLKRRSRKMCGTQIKTVFICVHKFYHGSLAQGNSKYIVLHIEKSRLLLLAIASKFFILYFRFILFYFLLFCLANTNHFHTFRQRVLKQNSIICICFFLHISQHLYNNTNRTERLYTLYFFLFILFGGFSSNIFPLLPQTRL